MLADDRSRWALKGAGDRSCASDIVSVSTGLV